MSRIMKSIQVCFLHNAYVERLENGHIGGLEDTLMISINAQLLKPAADICAVMWHLYAAFCHLLFILHPPIISFITPVCSGHRRFCTCRGFVVLSWFNVIIQALRAQDNPARYIHRRHGQIVREWKVLRNSYGSGTHLMYKYCIDLKWQAVPLWFAIALWTGAGEYIDVSVVRRRRKRAVDLHHMGQASLTQSAWGVLESDYWKQVL